MIYLGIDNGVTGSLGLVFEDDMAIYKPMPVVRCLNYTKSKQWLHRIDGVALRNYLQGVAPEIKMCLMERPMIMPGRWKATVSAIRALEATQTVLESLQIPYSFIDSKEWQRVLLPKGLEKQELKDASHEVGRRLFPHVNWSKWRDADGLLIAEYCRRITKNQVADMTHAEREYE